MLAVGVASLQLFVQNNWLGAGDQFVTEDGMYDKGSEKAAKNLILDGESIYPTVKCRLHLLIARCILHDLKDHFPCLKVTFS